MNQDVNLSDHFEPSTVTPELMSLVVTEVMERMTGKKKWSNSETLKQIILNKYTILKLEKEKDSQR